MADDREVELRLTATDEASDVVGKVADALDDLPEQTDLDVTADTRDARSNVERLADELDDATSDTRELRVVFRAEQLQREIRGALRDLESLEDPVDIEARTRDLERAQAELRELAELADKRYEIQIDADPKRTARRAADDVDAIRTRGEGLQSAIPAIRGFGDELGGVAQGAGVAGQAVADLGDFALIAGERFAAEGSRMAGVATRLGTALGAAGLVGAFAGIAVQLTSTVLPAVYKWITGAEDATEATEKFATSTRDAAEALAEGRYREAIQSLIDENREMIDSAREAGISQQDLVAAFLGTAGSLELLREKYGDDVAGPFIADAQIVRRELLRNQTEYEKTQALVDELAGSNQRAAGSTDRLTSEQRKNQAMARGLAAATARLGDDTDDAATAADRLYANLDRVLGEDDYREATIRLGQAFDEFAARARAGFDSVEEGELALIDLRRQVADYARDVLGLPDDVVTDVVAELDENNVAEIERRLNQLAATRRARYIISTEFDGYPGGFLGPGTGGPTRGFVGADAGPSTRSTGPVASVSRRGLTINVRTDASMRQVDRAIKRWQRVNG